jgi:tetratricopeptide (TPR) repeat protein
VWVNFAVSRNEALDWVESEVSPNSWIVLLDAADEFRVPAGYNISSILPTVSELNDRPDMDGLFVRQIWKNTVVDRQIESNELKVIRSGVGWRWRHPVHEMLWKEDSKCEMSAFQIVQDRSTESEKSTRRAPWLSALGRKQDALHMYIKRYQAKKCDDPWERYSAIMRIAELHTHMQNVNEAIDWYNRAVAESERLGCFRPESERLGCFRPEGLIHIGRIYRQLGMIQLACMYLSYAAQIEVDQKAFGCFDKHLLEHTRWNELSVVAWKLGHFEQGKEAAKKAGADLSWYEMHPIFKHSYYINLTERADRRKHAEKELKKILINNPIRIDAIKDTPGIVGCLKSHIKALETFMVDTDDPFVAIFEDDVVFKNPDVTIKCVRDIAGDEDWDVLLLGGMNDGAYEKYKNLPAVRVQECMSCVAYIVRRTFVPTLLTFWKNFLIEIEEKISVSTKMSDKIRLEDIALDRAWFKLQQKNIFILTMPLCVTQLVDYSNNWNRKINWDEKLLTL